MNDEAGESNSNSNSNMDSISNTNTNTNTNTSDPIMVSNGHSVDNSRGDGHQEEVESEGNGEQVSTPSPASNTSNIEDGNDPSAKQQPGPTTFESDQDQQDETGNNDQQEQTALKVGNSFLGKLNECTQEGMQDTFVPQPSSDNSNNSNTPPDSTVKISTTTPMHQMNQVLAQLESIDSISQLPGLLASAMDNWIQIGQEAQCQLESAQRDAEQLKQAYHNQSLELERYKSKEHTNQKSIENLWKSMETSNSETKDILQATTALIQVREELQQARSNHQDLLGKHQESQRSITLLQEQASHYKTKVRSLTKDKLQLQKKQEKLVQWIQSAKVDERESNSNNNTSMSDAHDDDNLSFEDEPPYPTVAKPTTSKSKRKLDSRQDQVRGRSAEQAHQSKDRGAPSRNTPDYIDKDGRASRQKKVRSLHKKGQKHRVSMP